MRAIRCEVRAGAREAVEAVEEAPEGFGRRQAEGFVAGFR